MNYITITLTVCFHLHTFQHQEFSPKHNPPPEVNLPDLNDLSEITEIAFNYDDRFFFISEKLFIDFHPLILIFS